MKIRIITHHSVHNHGAVLQLYALKKILSLYDETVCALEYAKNYDFLEENAGIKYNISLKSVPFYIKFLKQKGLKRTLFNIKKRNLLNKFKSKNELVGEYYSHVKNVDAVFVGSDEVFSIEPGLNPFFWGMGVPAKHVFAYAGCFGPTTLDFIKEKNATEYIEAGIRHLEKISVRDKNSKNIIEMLSDKTVEQVCDPVILYGYCKEKENFKRPIKKKYILIYAYDEHMNDYTEWRFIREYAKSKNLKVITVGFYHKWCDKCINVDPIKLLEWIADAECVITDTFHGTVMSLIMNVQFVTKIRGNTNKLLFLLSEYGVEDREIVDFSELEEFFLKRIDYGSVNEIIKEKREQGLAYISSCLQNIV